MMNTTDQTIPAAADNHVDPELPGTIRKVLITEAPLVRDHLLRLDGDSRRRRFFREVSDDFLRAYALKFAEIGTIIYGYFIDGEIRAIAELKRSPGSADAAGEAAFSVEKEYANTGIGTELMGRIILSARNRGLKHLVLVCLPDNMKMRAIAAKYAKELHFEDGASVADIIPQTADCMSIVSEAFDDRLSFMHALFDLDQRILKTLAMPAANLNSLHSKSA